MLTGPLVFIDVDTQRDFLDPAGALYVPRSDEILGNLARLTAFARAHRIPVLASGCSHTADDPELEVFPPHCMKGSPGQERTPATAWPGSVVLEPEERLTGDVPAHVTLHKREYSLFSHPEADRLVSLHDLRSPTFVVYGVATDYCVRTAALGLLDRSVRTALVVDAMRPIDRSAEPELFESFVARGALLVLTDVVCGP
jgi:nicotinamidase/pyrazinamidase